MGDSKRKKILVFEDEHSFFHPLKLKLETLGYDVMHASAGKEGLEELKRGGFDMILLDLMMPEVDGFEVLKSIRDMRLSVPVIVLSNLINEADRARAGELGASEYFIKSEESINDLTDHMKVLLSD